MRARNLPEINGIVGRLRIEARTLWKVKDGVKAYWRVHLPRSEARRRYITLGEEVLVEEMQREALSFDAARESDPDHATRSLRSSGRERRRRARRQDARRDTHLVGSQAAYQVAVMQLSLEDFVDAGGINDVAYPSPADFEDAESWIMAVASIEAARGPRHGGQLAPGYATRWALWLGQAAHGIWSERLASPSAIEFAEWARRIERQLLSPALDHFGLETPPQPTSSAMANCPRPRAGPTEAIWTHASPVTHPDATDGLPLPTHASPPSIEEQRHRQTPIAAEQHGPGDGRRFEPVTHIVEMRRRVPRRCNDRTARELDGAVVVEVGDGHSDA